MAKGTEWFWLAGVCLCGLTCLVGLAAGAAEGFDFPPPSWMVLKLPCALVGALLGALLGGVVGLLATCVFIAPLAFGWSCAVSGIDRLAKAESASDGVAAE